MRMNGEINKLLLNFETDLLKLTNFIWVMQRVGINLPEVNRPVWII